MRLMPRMRSTAVFVVCLLLVAGTTSLPAQAPAARQSPDGDALNAKSREFAQRYRAKDYPGAERAADAFIELARKLGRTDVVGAMLYNKSCVAALTGRRSDALQQLRAAIAAGYTSYYTIAGDTDFASLADDGEFKALVADLKGKAGIAALEWDAARTTAPFTLIFDDPALPALVEMRREFDLDAIVAGAGDDYARLKAITEWASRQWRHSPTAMASHSDPVTVLREAKAGGRFICRDYATVVAGVARAFSLPARVLNLLPRDVETRSEAHSVAEVWLPQFKKWVLADGQFGVVAERSGVPLNGVELQAALACDDASVRCASSPGTCRDWKPFILRNAYYFKIGRDQRRFEPSGDAQLVLVPKGASDPRKFAGGNEEVFKGAVYISAPSVFYAPPTGSEGH